MNKENGRLLQKKLIFSYMKVKFLNLFYDLSDQKKAYNKKEF